MFRFTGLILLVTLSLAAFSACLAQSTTASPQWGEFKARFGKSFATSAEETKRKAIYESNLKMVQDWNADPTKSFKLAMNQLSDQTTEEVLAKRTGLKKENLLPNDILISGSIPRPSTGSSIYPKALSYVGTNMVTSVKDQGSCGSCWAFAVSQAVQAQAAKNFSRTILPSEQQLVDCETQSFGCNGGYMSEAYMYMDSGIQNITTYPYNSGFYGYSYTCSANRSQYVLSTKNRTSYVPVDFGYDFGSFVLLPDQGYGDLDATVYDLTIAALNKIGPMSIGVCANSLFKSYSGGVFNNNGNRCTNSEYNHAVLLVGYNKTSSNTSEHYWIVKNSWNTWWGDSGYIRLKMGAGLIRDPMFPVLKADSSTTRSPTTTKRTTTKSTTTKSTTRITTTQKTTKRTNSTTTRVSSVECFDSNKQFCTQMQATNNACNTSVQFRTVQCRLTCGTCY